MNKYRRLLDTPYECKKELDIKPIFIDDRIDEECKRIIDTFNETLMKVFHPRMSTEATPIAYAKSSEERDFSQLLNSLCKVIEIELNNSLVPLLVIDDAKPPFTLGQILLYLKLKNIDKLPKLAKQFFFDNEKDIYLLKNIRNEAMHTKLIDEPRFLQFYSSFCLLLGKGWFKILMDMKEYNKQSNF